MIDWNIVIASVTILLTLLGAQWNFLSRLDKRFNEVNGNLNRLKDELRGQLEYHEKHDDLRFSQMTDHIWMLRVRNAAKDGLVGPTQWQEYEKNYQKKDINEKFSLNPP